mgnify:CR=1 FL=1
MEDKIKEIKTETKKEPVVDKQETTEIKEEKKVLKKECISISEYSVKVLLEKGYIKEIKEIT